MNQLSFPTNTNTEQQKLYCYINHCHQIIIAKIIGLKGQSWQRIVFPTEKLLFMANDNCQIEVCRPNNKEVIHCSDLAPVQQQESI